MATFTVKVTNAHSSLAHNLETSEGLAAMLNDTAQTETLFGVIVSKSESRRDDNAHVNLWRLWIWGVLKPEKRAAKPSRRLAKYDLTQWENGRIPRAN